MTANMLDFIEHVVGIDPASPSVHALQLDGTKIAWYRERVEAWARGERIAPITMDVAWSRKCQAACGFCVFPETLVLMADGSGRRMIDVKPGQEVVSVDENGLPQKSTVTAHFQTSPSMRGLHIETLIGNIKCTADHLILTDAGWVAAGDLKVGDHVYAAFVDRGGKAGEAGEVQSILGQSGRSRTQGKGSASSRRIQQDKGSRAPVSRSQEADGRAPSCVQQYARVSGGGKKGSLREGKNKQCIREIPSRTFEGFREGNAPAADAWKQAYGWTQAKLRAARENQRAHDFEQSDESPGNRREDEQNSPGASRRGLFVQAIQASLAGRKNQGEAVIREGQAPIQHEDEGRQSYEGCANSSEGSRKLYARAPRNAVSENETNLERWENQGCDVRGERECEGGKQNRAEVVSDTAVLSWPVRGRRHILDFEYGERNSPESGFYLRRSPSTEGGSIASRDILASRPGKSEIGNRGLSSGGVASLCLVDEEDKHMDAASHQGRNKIVVGRYPILAIGDAGVSGVYDLECRPHHNFVAGSVVVHNCYAQLQSSEGGIDITKKQAFEFLEDAAAIGVKGVSLISDGESTYVPYYVESIKYGASLGLQIGISSNGITLTPEVLEDILPSLSYLRFNFSGGERKRYAEIMGLKQIWFDRVVAHIKAAMEIKRRRNLDCNVNMQFVVRPQDGDQIVPFAKLAAEIRPSYGILKHCADSVTKDLDVDYRKYSALFPLFEEAEKFSDGDFRIAVKWSRLQDEGKRDYQRCYGPPFLLQMSGNGLITVCGQKFNAKFQKFHMGRLSEMRFREIFKSERYWEVIRYIASDEFDAQKDCGENCLQTNTNSWLNRYVNGQAQFATTPPPPQMGFL